MVAYFFNPQIDDPEEYEKRFSDLKRYCEENNIDFVAPEHKPSEFGDLNKPYREPGNIKYIRDTDRYRRRRCSQCNSLVIQRTIEQAKKLRIRYFTTTLLCSPYKNHDEIIEVSNDKALDYGLTFYYQDFRKGYWMGRNYAKNHGIYLPSFCGCTESKSERRLE